MSCSCSGWPLATPPRRQPARYFWGRFTALFWALVVVAGLAVPAVIELTEQRHRLQPTLVSPLLLLTGGLCLRLILVAAGQ